MPKSVIYFLKMSVYRSPLLFTIRKPLLRRILFTIKSRIKYADPVVKQINLANKPCEHKKGLLKGLDRI